jgi:hypothetical protein
MLPRCVISSGGQDLDDELLAQAASARPIQWSSAGFKISTCGGCVMKLLRGYFPA